ncbi:MAG: DUF3606 domain-containing protein [Ferruginibacter sp.]
MSDNKKVTDKRDSVKIDMNDPSEVEYVHQQFPRLKHAQVVEVIKAKGPSRSAVMNYLKKLK